MKIFFYKTLLVAFIFFIVFKITIGSLINEIENEVYKMKSKENIERLGNLNSSFINSKIGATQCILANLK